MLTQGERAIQYQSEEITIIFNNSPNSKVYNDFTMAKNPPFSLCSEMPSNFPERIRFQHNLNGVM